MNMRQRSRIQFHCAIVFWSDTFVTEGVLLNLAVAGCAVQAKEVPTVGEYLQLAILVPGHDTPPGADVAKVRWVQPESFGVEFLRVPSAEQLALERFVRDDFSVISPM